MWLFTIRSFQINLYWPIILPTNSCWAQHLAVMLILTQVSKLDSRIKLHLMYFLPTMTQIFYLQKLPVSLIHLLLKQLFLTLASCKWYFYGVRVMHLKFVVLWTCTFWGYLVFICHVCSPVSLILSGLRLRSCSRAITFVKHKRRSSFIEQNHIRGIQPLSGENSDCFRSLIAGFISVNVKIPITTWRFLFLCACS